MRINASSFCLQPHTAQAVGSQATFLSPFPCGEMPQLHHQPYDAGVPWLTVLEHSLGVCSILMGLGSSGFHEAFVRATLELSKRFVENIFFFLDKSWLETDL